MRARVAIDPGALRHRMTIEAVIELPDGTGGLDRVWSSVSDIWAALEPASQRSFLSADQTQEEHTHRITLRFRSDVASGWRFRMGERLFDILTVRDPDERAAWLVCDVREEGR